MAGEYLEIYTYEYLLAQALAQVPDTLDKREGSIIFDAVAPACYELAEMYLQLRQFVDQSYAMTATGEWLTLRAQEAGLIRYEATYAVKKAVFANAAEDPISVSVGARFSTVTDSVPLNYVVTDIYAVDGVPVAGAYELTCETKGAVGNAYTGQLIPISYISGLSTATMQDTIQPARDVETDDELRARYVLKQTKKSFGGNVAQYNELLKSFSGVGDVQIYPAWSGGGTVKISVLDNQYRKASPSFVVELQTEIDPTPQATGAGIAPIGHQVTVVAPTEVAVDITATVVVKSGYTLPQVQSGAEIAISAFLDTLRREWGAESEANNYALAVYLARISSIILSVPGCANVSNITINGSAADFVLTQTAATQQLPIDGAVVLSE